MYDPEHDHRHIHHEIQHAWHLDSAAAVVSSSAATSTERFQDVVHGTMDHSVPRLQVEIPSTGSTGY